MPIVSEKKLNEFTERFNALENALETAEDNATYYMEAYDQAARAMLAAEDVGWVKLGSQVGDDGQFSLDQLKGISKQLQEWATTNPLLSRGNEIRCSYLFGIDYEVSTEDAETSISKRAQDAIDHPLNQNSVFSQSALLANERARYTDGNVFALYDRDLQRFQMVPFHQITDSMYNPSDPGEVWYFQRTYTARIFNAKTGNLNQKEVKEWYRTDTYKPRSGKFLASINGKPVVSNKVIVDSRVNRPVGQTWGLPDSFAAAPWALTYSKYLSDGAKVLASLAEWTWQLKPSTKKAGDQAGAKVKSNNGPAGTVITDMEVKSLPEAKAVDLNTGRPLAAQVASALGISVVILLSDPGQSGAYGTAQTLTDPTIRTMVARQELNTDFLLRCFRLLGITKPTIQWAKMAPDPDFREMQTKTAAWETGLFEADEVRGPIAAIAGINLLHDSAPEGVMIPNNSESLARLDVDADATGGTASAASKATGQGGAKKTPLAKDAKSRSKSSDGNNDLRDDLG